MKEDVEKMKIVILMERMWKLGLVKDNIAWV